MAPSDDDLGPIQRELGHLSATAAQYKNDREILLDLVSGVATLTAEMKQARELVTGYDTRCTERERRVTRLELQVAGLWAIVMIAGLGFWQFILPHISFDKH
jgi:hypothetical protein